MRFTVKFQRCDLWPWLFPKAGAEVGTEPSHIYKYVSQLLEYSTGVCSLLGEGWAPGTAQPAAVCNNKILVILFFRWASRNVCHVQLKPHYVMWCDREHKSELELWFLFHSDGDDIDQFCLVCKPRARSAITRSVVLSALYLRSCQVLK